MTTFYAILIITVAAFTLLCLLEAKHRMTPEEWEKWMEEQGGKRKEKK